MSIPQVIFTTSLIVVLLALAIYYAWRQWQTLHNLRIDDEISDEERQYLHRQAWRRLAGSGLMILFAGLLTGSFFFEERAAEMAARGEAARAEGAELVLTEEEEAFRNQWAMYWIVLLIGVMVILGLAAYDFLATRRFGLQRFRQLQADRRAMIAREIAMMRRDRNGQGG